MVLINETWGHFLFELLLQPYLATIKFGRSPFGSCTGISASPASGRRAADSFRRTPGSHGRNPDLKFCPVEELFESNIPLDWPSNIIRHPFFRGLWSSSGVCFQVWPSRPHSWALQWMGLCEDRVPKKSMVHHASSCFIMVHHGSSWLIMAHHGLSCFIMVYRGSSSFSPLETYFGGLFSHGQAQIHCHPRGLMPLSRRGQCRTSAGSPWYRKRWLDSGKGWPSPPFQTYPLRRSTSTTFHNPLQRSHYSISIEYYRLRCRGYITPNITPPWYVFHGLGSRTALTAMAIISFCSVSKFRRLAAAEHPMGRITKLRSDGSESCRHFGFWAKTDRQTNTDRHRGRLRRNYW